MNHEDETGISVTEKKFLVNSLECSGLVLTEPSSIFLFIREIKRLDDDLVIYNAKESYTNISLYLWADKVKTLK